MLRALKIRLYPNKEQEQAMNKLLGCYRFVYNQMLALKQKEYNENKKSLGLTDLSKYFHGTLLKDEQYEWLKEQNTKVMKQSIRQMLSAYDKFFNINERPETKFDMLQYKLQFPVTTYVKENGFLGIVSYNEYEDDLFVASKSTIDSQFAQWFKDMLYEKVSSENLIKMKEFIKENNVSFVFECVDMKNDPHIIEYPESELFLLDIVRN